MVIAKWAKEEGVGTDTTDVVDVEELDWCLWSVATAIVTQNVVHVARIRRAGGGPSSIQGRQNLGSSL